MPYNHLNLSSQRLEALLKHEVNNYNSLAKDDILKATFNSQRDQFLFSAQI